MFESTTQPHCRCCGLVMSGSALAEVYRTLDEAELVAPGDDERAWVSEIRDQVRNELIHVIEDEEDSDGE